jgi:electron-transferring-flavoprotein dehydrogenase
MDQERQSMEVDIACVGFGPAMGGFLTTLSRNLVKQDGQPELASKTSPGLPLQILCYERGDDIGFGVSGVVTAARSIKKSFPELDCTQIPMACPVSEEKVVYLTDPIGASRRPLSLRAADRLLKYSKWLPFCRREAVELPYVPPFLQKEGGLLFSIGQFNQWVGSQIMGSGLVQIWPAMPVSSPIFEGDSVRGIRLVDQGTDKNGNPDANFMPGMDIRAALTVVGDGPVGNVGQKLNEHFGFPDGNHQRDWAVGMKAVVELPEDTPLKPGAVFHTFGYPEPEIFGFMYVYPDRLASLGIFVPSFLDSPVRTAYRFLQYWMMHPYLWHYLKGSTLRSWGAKSLQESGIRGEPQLVGDGFARIGEGSGSTNMLTGSGVDEAWETGTQLAESVIDLIKADQPFTRKNLEQHYVNRRRNSKLQKELKQAEKARDGFHINFIAGLIGMGISGLTGGRLNMPGKASPPYETIPSLEEYYQGKISSQEIEQVQSRCKAAGTSLSGALMERAGWPEIPLDGKLLISHQDALLLGGKVQAAPGYADHVKFINPQLCEGCDRQICIECCSGQAITPSEDGGAPQFDREKCIHCGACLWNCAKSLPEDSEHGNVDFSAGSGGLHSAEN